MDEAYRNMKKVGEEETERMSTVWEKFVYKFDKNDEKEESLQQVFDRTMQYMLETHKAYHMKGKNILITSHSVVLKSLLMADAAIHHNADMEYHRFDVPNCSVIVIDVQDGAARIVRTVGLKFRESPKY